MTTERIPVDLVIAIDSSRSMNDEAKGLSRDTERAIRSAETNCPSDLRVQWLGLEGRFADTNFERSVRDYLTKECGLQKQDLRALKKGDKNKRSPSEDGAGAITDIATHFDWRKGAKRAILYLSDEALDGSSNNKKPDANGTREADHAIQFAKRNKVVVHTYFSGSFDESNQDLIDLQAEFARVAAATGGQSFTSADALGGFADVLKNVICATKSSVPIPVVVPVSVAPKAAKKPPTPVKRPPPTQQKSADKERGAAAAKSGCAWWYILLALLLLLIVGYFLRPVFFPEPVAVVATEEPETVDPVVGGTPLACDLDAVETAEEYDAGLHLINGTGEQVSIFWLDIFQDPPTLADVGSVEAGEIFQQFSFVGHEFVVMNQAGETIYRYIVTEEPKQCEIFESTEPLEVALLDIPEEPLTTEISGQVVDATTGEPLSEGEICIQDGACVALDADGMYAFDDVGSADQTLLVTVPGYFSSEETVTVASGTTLTKNFALSPEITGASGEVRIVLTWGETPEDLDAHLFVPTDAEQRGFINFETQDAEMEFLFASLDIDNREGFGPETITISELQTGTYSHLVQIYNQTGSFEGTLVKVYDASGLIAEFAGPTEQGVHEWHVFDIDGATGFITEVNQLGEDEGARLDDSALFKSLLPNPNP